MGGGGSGPTPTLSPSFILAQAIFEPNLYPYKYPNMSQNLVIFHTYPPMKMEQCSETWPYKIQTPGNYPEKAYNIQNTVKVWNQEYKDI